MKKGQAKHKAGYQYWKGRRPKEFNTKSHNMTEDMRERIARRISKARGWSVEWLLSLDDSALKRIARNNL